jgi:hypothetical protein
VSKNITDLRDVLFDTLAQLRDKANPMEIDRARAICEVSDRLIETAKVECKYIDLVGAAGPSEFLPQGADPKARPAEPPQPRALTGGRK